MVVRVGVAHIRSKQEYKPILVIPADIQIVALSIPDALASASS